MSPRKLNSDPIEREFGKYRQSSGCNFLGSAHQILSAEKNQRLKKLIKIGKLAECKNRPLNVELNASMFDPVVKELPNKAFSLKDAEKWICSAAGSKVAFVLRCKCRELFLTDDNTPSYFANVNAPFIINTASSLVMYAFHITKTVFLRIKEDRKLFCVFIKKGSKSVGLLKSLSMHLYLKMDKFPEKSNTCECQVDLTRKFNRLFLYFARKVLSATLRSQEVIQTATKKNAKKLKTFASSQKFARKLRINGGKPNEAAKTNQKQHSDSPNLARKIKIKGPEKKKRRPKTAENKCKEELVELGIALDIDDAKGSSTPTRKRSRGKYSDENVPSPKRKSIIL